MLLPDNVNPYNSIYFNWALVLEEIKNTWDKDIIALYKIIKVKYDINFSVYVLCLDWLYLLNLAILDKNNLVKPCL